MTSGGPIRVLVVDDSILTRRVISAALGSVPDITVVGAASNGTEGLALVEKLNPDVVTLDVEMPRMDGLEVLRQIMQRQPTPVLMVSYLTHAGTQATVRAMLDGAVDFVAKPGGAIMRDHAGMRDDLIRKVRAAARSRPEVPGSAVPASPTTRWQARPQVWTGSGVLAPAGRATGGESFRRLVVIGTSTGGPRALQVVLRDLAADATTAYLVVQHMPAGMTAVLADLLDSCSPLAVREARDGDRLAPGTALLAPGDFHLRLSTGGVVQLDQGPKVHYVRPSVDVALLSVAELYGSHTVAAILTGMGSDGADGAAAIHAAGGHVIVEDKSTAVVWGMPRAVCQRGVADAIVPLPDVARAISHQLTSTGADQERVRA